MMAVFLSVSQWMFPSVLGFSSLDRTTATDTFQSSRLRRFCQYQSFSLVNELASRLRSRERSSVKEESAGKLPEEVTRSRSGSKRPENLGEKHPNMCSMITELSNKENQNSGIFSTSCEVSDL